MKRHELRCHPSAFGYVAEGRKTAEYRLNDRNFLVGDVLLLREWSEHAGYTGREVEVDVTHVVYGPAFGVPARHVVMSIRRRSGEVGARARAVAEVAA